MWDLVTLRYERDVCTRAMNALKIKGRKEERKKGRKEVMTDLEMLQLLEECLCEKRGRMNDLLFK